jgi:hypothetical protein
MSAGKHLKWGCSGNEGPSTDLKWGSFWELGPPVRTSNGAVLGTKGPSKDLKWGCSGNEGPGKDLKWGCSGNEGPSKDLKWGCSGNEGLVRGGKYPYTHSSLSCVDKKRTNSANPKPVDKPFLHYFQIGACQIVRSVVT